MKIQGQNYRTVWMEGDKIFTIDQLSLPANFKIATLNTIEDVENAISSMVVRGAPAIGAMGAYGLAQAILQLSELDRDLIDLARVRLEATRPTAYDLTHALDVMDRAVRDAASLEEAQLIATQTATDYANRSAEACQLIGVYGATIVPDNASILTHCNAGALATVDYGTALAVVRAAHDQGKNIHLFIDETRPRLQGAYLTAWEMVQEGIPHTLIADNAAGHFLQHGEIDIVITGADRVASNGDAANKIGTYEKAVLAREHNIPFYIAAPFSTIDFDCPTGAHIPIEERDPLEVLELAGTRIAPEGTQARNPAFDVTPARFITGIITERGIFKPDQLEQ